MMLLYIIVVLQLLSLTGASESGIVGGKVSKPHSRPYMASLQVNDGHVCGGMLIRKDFVLTAAHCRRDNKDKDYDITVVLGAHNIKEKEKSQQKIPVAEYHPHPEYGYNNNNNYKHDIMLLKLKTNAKLNKNVKTIGLPKMYEKIPDCIACLVIGWGQTGPGTPPSEVLREATVKMEFSDVCKYKWQNYFDSDLMICTHVNKTAETNVGIFQGDSGGPLICGGKAHGITSFNDLHNEWKNMLYCPNVFTKVPSYIQWIEKVMKKK